MQLSIGTQETCGGLNLASTGNSHTVHHLFISKIHVETAFYQQLMCTFVVQFGKTALLSAAKGGHVEVMDILLGKGASIASLDVIWCAWFVSVVQSFA